MLLRAADALGTTAASLLAPFEGGATPKLAITDPAALRVSDLVAGLPTPGVWPWISPSW